MALITDKPCAWDKTRRSFLSENNSVRCARTARGTCDRNPHCSSPSPRPGIHTQNTPVRNKNSQS